MFISNINHHKVKFRIYQILVIFFYINWLQSCQTMLEYLYVLPLSCVFICIFFLIVNYLHPIVSVIAINPFLSVLLELLISLLINLEHYPVPVENNGVWKSIICNRVFSIFFIFRKNYLLLSSATSVCRLWKYLWCSVVL